MFADDTTLYDADADLGLLLSKFSKKLEPLLDWCKFNKLDLNWSKRYSMFITSQRVKLPIEILLSGLLVKVVDTFRLLSIISQMQIAFYSL